MQDCQISSHDLIEIRHIQIGCDVSKRDACTNTSEFIRVTKETSTDDLILQKHDGIGVDMKINRNDVAVSAKLVSTDDVALSCSLPIRKHTQRFDKMTMTLLSGTEVFRFVDANTNACEVDADNNQLVCQTAAHTRNNIFGPRFIAPKAPTDGKDNVIGCSEHVSSTKKDATFTNSLYLDIRQNVESKFLF